MASVGRTKNKEQRMKKETYGDEGDVKAVHEAVDVVEGQETEDDEVFLLDDLGIVAHDLNQVRGNVTVGQHHTLALAYYWRTILGWKSEAAAAPAPAGRMERMSGK
jgi:hypothetical protein